MKQLTQASQRWILRLFDAGWSYYAIHRETRHAVNAIKRVCIAAGHEPHTNGYRSPHLRGKSYNTGGNGTIRSRVDYTRRSARPATKRVPIPTELTAYRAWLEHERLPKNPAYQALLREAAAEFDDAMARQQQLNGKKGGRPKKLKPLITSAKGKAA